MFPYSGCGIDELLLLLQLFRMLKGTTPRTAKEMKSMYFGSNDDFIIVCKTGMEQNMVPWKKDKDEKQCGGCGAGFGLMRRRHHCRLCGNIRCKECCNFMTLADTCTS